MRYSILWKTVKIMTIHLLLMLKPTMQAISKDKILSQNIRCPHGTNIEPPLLENN